MNEQRRLRLVAAAVVSLVTLLFLAPDTVAGLRSTEYLLIAAIAAIVVALAAWVLSRGRR